MSDSHAVPADPPSIGLANGERLELSRDGGVWIVKAGRLEVYYTDRNASSPARTFLFEVHAGALIPCLRGSAHELNVELFAIGFGARVHPLDAAQMKDWFETTPSGHRDGKLAAWLDRLTARVTLPSPPQRYQSLAVDAVVDLPATGIVRPIAGLCWVMLQRGACHIKSRRALALSRDEALPITPDLWLEAGNEGARVRTMSTPPTGRRGSALDGIERMSTNLLAVIVDDDRAMTEAERERLQASVAREARLLGRSYEELGGIMERWRRPPPGRDRGGGLLLEACRAVGAELGLEIVAPPNEDVGPGARRRDPVQAIASASKIRCRRVMLRGEWWTGDHGPLLAFVEDDRRPVALVQRRGARRPGRYEIYDPTNRGIDPVTREVAQTLAPSAYMFFQGFGYEDITPAALVKMAWRTVRGDFWLVVLMSAAASLLALAAPFLSQVLFDDVIPQANRAQLPIIAAALFAVAVVAALLMLVRGFALLRLEAKAETATEAALMDRLLRLPAAFFRQYLVGDLAQRVMGVATIRNALTGHVLAAILGGVFSVTSLGLVFYYDPAMGLVAIGLTAVALSVMLISNFIALGHKRQLLERAGRLSGLVLQFLTSMAKLRTAAAERRAFGVWASEFSEQHRHGFAAGAIHNNFQSFAAAFPVLSSLVFFAVIYVVTERSQAGAVPLSTGAFVAILAAFGQFLGAMLGLGEVMISVVDVIPHYERMRPILRAPLESHTERIDPGLLTGDIEITRLTFRYHTDGPLIFNDLSLRVHQGEMVALVGPSGSGKSTLMRLLLGFEQPDSGAIRYDGKDLSSLDLDAVRQQLGVVLQHGQVVEGDIYSNIVGPWDLSLEDAWRAAEMVGLAEDIRNMPMGMYTLVGEAGGTFSGGQRQRLLLARAIVHRPRIVLLDEATSALDNVTQGVVSSNLEQLGITRIIIAHRLSTIRNADRIYVLDAGRIGESGTYQSLIDQRGTFAALAGRQLL